jgi:hypothetical protein
MRSELADSESAIDLCPCARAMVPLSRRAGAGPGDGGQPIYSELSPYWKGEHTLPGGTGGTGLASATLVARRERTVGEGGASQRPCTA